MLFAVLIATAGGCAQIPEVESRLRSMKFVPNMYVVQAGDTWESIAFRYRFETTELVALNPGTGEYLRPGMRINVRPGTELPDEIRAAARVAPGPVTLEATPGEAMRNAEPTRPLGTATTTTAPASGVATAPVQSPSAPVIIAETPAAIPGSSTNVTTPGTPQAVVIATARFDPRTGGAPNEEVVADDLGPLPGAATAPSTANGYTPVPAADAAAATSSAGSSGWVWPTDGAVARAFAPERIGGQGVDIAGVPGQDVRAAAAGTVVYSGKDLSGGGNLVILRHGDDLMTTYSHTDKLFVTEDDTVRAGDPIASLGANDQAESVLRFEVRRDGSPLDPMEFLAPR